MPVPQTISLLNPIFPRSSLFLPVFWRLCRLAEFLPFFQRPALTTRIRHKDVGRGLFWGEFWDRILADVKMNHVRTGCTVSIRNMAQGSDPGSIGKEKDFFLFHALFNYFGTNSWSSTTISFHLFKALNKCQSSVYRNSQGRLQMSNLKKESNIEAIMDSCSAFQRLSLITMVPSLQRAKLISFEWQNRS